MGDFYLDLRPSADRGSAEQARRDLSWFPDTATHSFIHSDLALVVSRSDDAALWSPATTTSATPSLIVALAGRVALSASDWCLADQSNLDGGRACRAIGVLYRRNGISAIEELSGNFVIVIVDSDRGHCHLVTDRAGMQIAYQANGRSVFSSHPDVLAAALGEEQDLDEISLAEFVAHGRLSFPYTYYKNVRGLPWSSTYSFSRVQGCWSKATSRKYATLEPRFGSEVTTSLADDLAEAFRSAIRLRSLPLLGRTAVAMSGGMDSRAVLASTMQPDAVEGFCLVNEPNPESVAANGVADACGTTFHLLRRDFDHYGTSAEAGARLGGAGGGLASNHFLGVRPWLRQRGIGNLLTGCYSDYLFKALALNIRETPALRREVLAPYTFDFYRPIYRGVTLHERDVHDRVKTAPPQSLHDDEGLFIIERDRTFPLAYEADSAQRVIAQRAFPWCVPMADKGLLEVYQRIPSRLKLNGTLFREMLRRICPPEVLAVPNSNSGGHILAGQLSRTYHRYRSAMLNRINTKANQGIANRGSWPNWDYYIKHSTLLREQWNRAAPAAADVLHRVVPASLLRRSIQDFTKSEVELFQRLWTLKLWLECRVGSHEVPLSLRRSGEVAAANPSSP